MDSTATISALVKHVRTPILDDGRDGLDWAKQLVLHLRALSNVAQSCKSSGHDSSTALLKNTTAAGTALARSIMRKEPLPSLQKLKATFTRHLVAYMKEIQKEEAMSSKGKEEALLTTAEGSAPVVSTKKPIEVDSSSPSMRSIEDDDTPSPTKQSTDDDDTPSPTKQSIEGSDSPLPPKKQPIEDAALPTKHAPEGSDSPPQTKQTVEDADSPSPPKEIDDCGGSAADCAIQEDLAKEYSSIESQLHLRVDLATSADFRSEILRLADVRKRIDALKEAGMDVEDLQTMHDEAYMATLKHKLSCAAEKAHRPSTVQRSISTMLPSRATGAGSLPVKSPRKISHSGALLANRLGASREKKKPKPTKGLRKRKYRHRMTLRLKKGAPVRDEPEAPKSHKTKAASQPSLPPKPGERGKTSSMGKEGESPMRAKEHSASRGEHAPSVPHPNLRKPEAVRLETRKLSHFDAAAYTKNMSSPTSTPDTSTTRNDDGVSDTHRDGEAHEERDYSPHSSVIQGVANSMLRIDGRTRKRSQAIAPVIHKRPLVPHRPLRGANYPLQYRYGGSRGRPMVIGGTAASLLRHAVDCGNLLSDAKQHCKVFLRTYIFFKLAPEVFLGELLYIYLTQQIEIEQAMVAGQIARPRGIQVRVIQLLQAWTSSEYCYTLSTDQEAIGHCRRRLKSFLKANFILDGKPEDTHEDVKPFDSLVTQLDVIERVSKASRTLGPSPSIDGADSDPMLSRTPQNLAQNLTALHFSVLRRVTPRELWNEAWNKRPHEAPNLLVLIRQWNDLSFWMQGHVVHGETPRARARAIKYFLKMGSAFLASRNFHGVMAVLSALSSSSIERLKRTWQVIGPKYGDILQNLQMLFDPSGNMKRYRTTLSASTPPSIPFMGTVVNDLTMMGAEPNELEDPSPTAVVNYAKMWRFSDSFDELRRFVSQKYPFPPCDIHLKSFFLSLGEKSDGRLSSAEEIYARSLEVEPRGPPAPRANVKFKTISRRYARKATHHS